MMFKWTQFLRNADSHTIYFLFNWALYGILIIASTIYVYARLDYVRSAPLPGHQKVVETEVKK